MGRVHFTINDAILLITFTWVAGEIFSQWNGFNRCAHPIHIWLLVSFSSVILNRCSHYLGQLLSDETLMITGDDPDEFLLYMDAHGPPKWLSVVSLGLLFPFFIFWTAVGTVWFTDVVDRTPFCVSWSTGMIFPSDNAAWLILLWLVLCYVWASLYVLFIVVVAVTEYRARVVENSLSLIENEALIRRWGRLRVLADYGYPLITNGFSAEKIAKLPFETLTSSKRAEELARRCGSCAICLDGFFKSEEIRTIYPCRHVFHRACIDIWLLRQAVCPNCKGVIRSRLPSWFGSIGYPSCCESLASSSSVTTVEDNNEREKLLPNLSLAIRIKSPNKGKLNKMNLSEESEGSNEGEIVQVASTTPICSNEVISYGSTVDHQTRETK